MSMCRLELILTDQEYGNLKAAYEMVRENESYSLPVRVRDGVVQVSITMQPGIQPGKMERSLQWVCEGLSVFWELLLKTNLNHLFGVMDYMNATGVWLMLAGYVMVNMETAGAYKVTM